MPFSPADFTFCILQTAYLICKSLLFRWHKCEAFLLFSGNYFHVKYNTLYFMSIKRVLCEAIGSANKTLHTDYQYAQNLEDLSFFYEKTETKNHDLCHLSKGWIGSRGSFKKDKGQVVFFNTLRCKLSTLYPCLFYFVRYVFRTESRTQQNQNLLDFRFSRITDKTT